VSEHQVSPLFAGTAADGGIAKPWFGNWEAFPKHLLPDIYRAAEAWRAPLQGISKPWLCWCVSDPWCVLQQRLVQSVGWTPVVGWDTNITQPTILPGSIAIDFNAQLKMPRCFMYFVLEWIFLFAPERLAFWHVDFLMTHQDMARAAACFAALQPGQMALPWNRANWVLRTLAPYRRMHNENRLFEVVGCITTEASRQHWEEGLSIWRHPECHPQSPLPTTFPHWETSIGLTLWAKRHPERHVVPRVDIKTGHATAWKLPGVDGATTPKQQQLEAHANLHHYAQRLGIAHFLEAPL
jgi:hypothetical protein